MSVAAAAAASKKVLREVPIFYPPNSIPKDPSCPAPHADPSHSRRSSITYCHIPSTTLTATFHHHHVHHHQQQARKGGQESNDVCQGSASRRQAGRIAPRLVPAAGHILLSLPPHNVEENPLRCLNLFDWHRLLLLRWSLSHPLCRPPSCQAQRHQCTSRHSSRYEFLFICYCLHSHSQTHTTPTFHTHTHRPFAWLARLLPTKPS